MSTVSETDEYQADNANFVQLSRAYLHSWRGLIRKNPLATEILMFFIEKMGRTTNAVVCSYKTLTELTGYSRTSVANAIKALKDDNWIDTVKIGNATAYCVNERVAWQAKKNQRKYALFSATVVASESEQDSDFHKKINGNLKHIPFVDKNERITLGGDELPPPDQSDLDLD
ncbi:plasmid replication initiation protein [Salmonella enterica subsp. enterica]|nr:plasmid replication initiation protein [Salmonella enterica subsp. salamae]EDS4164686.1 plasmid replication initiation protein [Salmonella enterica subsp. enterica]